MKVKATRCLVKTCPTCLKYIREYSGQIFLDHKHQSIRLNLDAKHGRWHHKTKRGRIIHSRAVGYVGELIDNSIESVARDLAAIEARKK